MREIVRERLKEKESKISSEKEIRMTRTRVCTTESSGKFQSLTKFFNTTPVQNPERQRGEEGKQIKNAPDIKSKKKKGKSPHKVPERINNDKNSDNILKGEKYHKESLKSSYLEKCKVSEETLKGVTKQKGQKTKQESLNLSTIEDYFLRGAEKGQAS